MDFANRGNRPAQQPQQPMTQKDSSNAPAPQNNKKRMKGVDLGKLSSIFMLFGVTAIIFTLILAMVFGGNRSKESELIQKDKYQAVFLDSSDGQVYFGNLSVFNSNTYVLEDIYYVRVENSIQTADNQQQQANISLAKLGNELHAPQDSMYISKVNVLYWENLTDEGQVVTAIKDYKENGEKTPEDTTQQTQQQSQASGTQPTGTAQQNDTPDTQAETPPATN